MSLGPVVFVESNTSGTGRLFARSTASRGFRPILLTSDPNRYKYARQDRIEVLKVDTQRKGAIIDACQRIESDGSVLAGVTSSSEYFIETAAAVARKLELHGPSPDAIAVCRDKFLQRQLLKQSGVSVPQFYSAFSTQEAVAAALEIGFPVV